MMGITGIRFLACFALALGLAACAETQLVANSTKLVTTPEPPPRTPGYKIGKPYQLEGTWYYPKVDYSYDESGIASWYGPDFNGKPTASGEIYDQNGLTAAHRTLPMPTIVQVTNLENGRSIKLRVNDRGPFARGRIIDVSQRAAQLLGFLEQGTARVRVQVIADESQALAAALSGGTMVPEGEPQPTAPEAAPTMAVTEANLSTLSSQMPPSGASPTTVASSGVTAAVTPAPAPATVPAATTVAAVPSTAQPGATLGSTATTPAAGSGTVAPPGTPSIVLNKPATPSPATATTTTPVPASVAAPASAPVPAPTPTASVPPPMPTTTTAAPSASPSTTTVAAVPAPKPSTTTVAQTPAPSPSPSAGGEPMVAAGYEPTGKVTQYPVQPSSIFIQAGAFTKKQNAEVLTAKLRELGPTSMTPVKIGGQQFYRVRLGPLNSVTEADRLLDELVRRGHPEARIVVD